MINRALIRIKVVQMMYNYYLSRDIKTPEDAIKELNKSFDSSYDTYNLLLLLMREITHMQELNLDDAKYRYGATDEDLSPNTRFIDNEFIKLLREDTYLNDNLKNIKYSWFDNQPLLRLLVDKVLKTEAYANYMAMPDTDFESDCQVWKSLMKDCLLQEENLRDELQELSIYVGDDDIDTMGQFVIKTIRRYEMRQEHPLLPKFKNEEDEQFGISLLSQCIRNIDENNEIIDNCAENGKWAGERIATMDRIIMLVALTELRGYPNIPIVVSLNEYIEIAKSFSTAQSGNFINGILMAALNNLRKDKKLLKANI